MCISGYSISFRSNSWYRNGFVRYHSNGGVPALLNFLDAPSAIITIGGSLSAVLCSNKLSGFIAGIKSFALPFKEKSVDPGETINK